MIFCHFQENRSQSNDFYNWFQTFALKVKFMSTKTNVKIKNFISSLVCVLYRMKKRSVRTFDKYIRIEFYLFVSHGGKGVGEGGTGGHVPPHFQKWGGGHKWVCAPPPLLGRANVLISLFAHILWLKTQFFQNFLGSLRSPTLINQYFLNFANLKL